MAFEVMAWAVKQDVPNSGAKLVLLLLANHTNGHTGQCNPSQGLLAKECCMGLSTLRRHLADLEEAGFISVVHQYAENMKRPNQYIINFQGSSQESTEEQNRANDHPNRRYPPSKSDVPLPPNRMIETGITNRNVNRISMSGSVPTVPFNELIDLYEKHLPDLPAVRKSLFATGSNAKATKQRWEWVMTSCHERGPRSGQRLAETVEQGLEWFDKYFSYVSQSDFLTGKSNTWAGCNLGWLMNRANFEKVLSGQYHKKD